MGLPLDVLSRMEVRLVHHGRVGPTKEDRAVLAPRFERLSRDAAASVLALNRDLVTGHETSHMNETARNEVVRLHRARAL